MSRRNFTRAQKEQIVERARDADGVVRCEGCRLALKPGAWEIDHIIAEALRPEADKQRPITIAEGQLLGKECCHRGADGKTNKDVKAIAKGKRQYNAANGLKAKSRPIPQPPKQPRQQTKTPLPPKLLFRTAQEPSP